MRLRAIGGVWLLALLSASAASGQEPTPASVADRDPACAFPRAPLLPPEHWAVRAADRAEELGLTREYLPAQDAVRRDRVGAVLREAAERAAVETPAWSAVAVGLHARFVEEFPEFDGSACSGGGLHLLGSRAFAGARGSGGRLAPARGLFDWRTDPVPIADSGSGVIGTTVAASIGSKLVLEMRPSIDAGGAALEGWELTGAAGGAAVSLARAPVRYGPGRGGGIVFSGAVPLTGLHLETTGPFRLPGFLRRIGPVAAHAFLGRLDEERHRGDPYLFGMRVAFQPHPRLTMAVNRGSIFSGDSVSRKRPLSPRFVARMLVGALSKDFENQVVSADLRFRLPTERVLPLTAYLEWGADDAAGGWWDVPARTLGIRTPALPALPEMALGAEVTRFAPLCCGNPAWYTHVGHPGGWVVGDEMLGHPLGGEGWEVLGYGSIDSPSARIRLDGRAFARRRTTVGYDIEFLRGGNLYLPQRAGGSVGLDGEAAWRLSPRTEARVSGALERGADWTRRAFAASLSLFF